MALLGPGGLMRSKTGCKTCRIRRVKCDEARPNCKPCQKSGRKCDWYSSSPNQLARRSHCPTPIPCSSLPALPDFDSPRQKELFSFFVYYTSEASAVYFGANFWAYRVLQLSLSEPSIRYAICSLSALHKTYSDPSIGTKELSNYALQQYNHAVRYTQAVLADSSGGSAETLVKGLVACILFVCYENFTGNYDISYMHLKSGLQILKRESRDNRVPQDIVQAFKRLDLQAVSFGGARKTYRGRSVDEQIDLIPSPPPEVSSLEDSVDVILSLCGWMFRRTTVQESCPISQDDLNAAGTFLKQWNIQVSSLITTKQRGRRVSTLLRIYQIILTIVISTLTHRKETLHNDHLHSYITVLNLAEELLQSSSTSTQFFSFDVGIIFPLFWIAIKCRDSSIRRNAVDLLAGLNHREGAWTSQNAAKIARFVIDVEEDGLSEFVSQDQVEESRRVHLVSTTADKEARWIHLCCFMRDNENNWYNKEGRIPYDDKTIMVGNGVVRRGRRGNIQLPLEISLIGSRSFPHGWESIMTANLLLSTYQLSIIIILSITSHQRSIRKPFLQIGGNRPLAQQSKMATTTFHPFGSLSRELREIIWQHASGGDGYDQNGPGRTIEVLLLPSNAHWINPDQAKQCKPHLGPLRFDFRLLEGSRADEDLKVPKRAHPLSQANSHSREVFRHLNPDALRIVDLDNPKRSGPLIRFNASRDKIFMDLETLYYLKQYASYLDTKTLNLPRLLCGFDRIQTLSRPLGSTLEVAHAMLRLLEGGPTLAEYAIIPSIQGLHIDDSVAGSVTDFTTLSRRLYRTLNGMWHWSLSREQRACIERGLDRVQNLGQQPSLRSENVIDHIRRLPVERGFDGGTDEHE